MSKPSRTSWNDVPSSGRLGRTLVAAFAGTIFFFLLSDVVANRREHGITVAAENTASDALPAIQHLASARTALRVVSNVLDDLTGGAPSGRVPEDLRDELRRSRDVLRREWQAYEALPLYPGESALQSATDPSVHSAERSFDDVLARIQSGDAPGARVARNTYVLPEVERLDAQLHAIVDLNAARGAEQSRAIASLRSQSRSLGFGLHALSALFACLAAVLLARLVHRFERLKTLRVTELEHFAGRIAHDIRSPLGSIALAVELARKDPRLEVKSRSRLEHAGKTVQRIGELVDGLLVFAVAGAPPPEDARASVREVLDGVLDVMRPMADEKDVDLHAERFADVALACTPGVLTSVLVNLIGNAIKYMGEAPVRRVVVRARAVGPSTRIEVSDTGPGVPPELKNRIFFPYVRAATSEVSGLGLGLATVRRLVEAHGGAVGVEDGRAVGSVFWAQLPQALEGEKDSLGVSRRQEGVASGLT